MEGLAWRPGDGGLLASFGRDRRIYAWDAATHKQKAVMEGAMGGGIRIAFNHEGDALAGRDATGLLRLWDPRTGRQLFSTTADMRALRFSPDDRLLAGEVDGAEDEAMGCRHWPRVPNAGRRTRPRPCARVLGERGHPSERPSAGRGHERRGTSLGP